MPRCRCYDPLEVPGCARIRAAVRAGDGDCAVLMSVVRCRLIDNLDRLSDVDAGPGVVRTGALPSVDT
jgi:hypothetical protein